MNAHRIALRTARQNRLNLIARSTAQLVERMDAAAGTANAKVLLHPLAAKSVVESSNVVALRIGEFRGALGIESGRQALDAKRRTHAVSEVRDKVVETGASGVDAALRLGSDTYERATGVFRSVDLDGDGVVDKPRGLRAVEVAGASIKGATRGAAQGRGCRREAPEGSAPTSGDGPALRPRG